MKSHEVVWIITFAVFANGKGICSTLGNGAPERDMLVSPQQRMLITSDVAAVMFDEREVLVAAKHLTGLDGVDQVQTGAVSYMHLMFD
ncbi:MAG: Hint domain-containing protein, partial [Pseudomonadota bacterium]